MPIKHACGKAKCGVSTGICESLTFGSGNLDFNGYWEHGCYECARQWEKLHPEDGPCWPFKSEDIPDAKQSV